MFKFYLDEAGEREILQQMFSGWSGCSVKERALQYGIPLDIARQCEKTDVPCPALADYLAKGYVLYRKELKQALTFHKRYWREHRLETKEKLKNIFGHKIPPYTVRLNLQCDGISNWYGTDISINAFQYLRPEKHRHVRTLLWELILSQTFMDIRKRYSADKFDDNQVWGMAELTAVSCIQTDFEHNSEDWSIGYEELEPRRDMVKFIYQRRKNFRDYLEQLTDYFIKHPLKKGCR